MKNLSMAEQLMYTTVRIECNYKNKTIGSGTGFFYMFQGTNNNEIPVIITNTHVINNAEKIYFILTLKDKEGDPQNNKHIKIEYEKYNDSIFLHPGKVDLCALPIAPILNTLSKNDQYVFYIPLNKNIIPSKEQLDDIDAIENIIMIGYPNGIWDSVNNFPILRRGSTATHPCVDYNGKREFLIDIACFPGSSGSPVFIYNQNGYATKQGVFNIGGSRVLFMGILYRGFQHNAQGEIKVIDVPTFQQPITSSNIPNNIGIVIKSERILEFEDLFKKIS